MSKGLFRTLLAGEGASLTDAFSTINLSDKVRKRIDIPEKSISTAYVDLPKEEGSGFWELININENIFAVITKCDFKDVRTEIVPPEDFLEIHVCFSGPVHLDLSGDEEFDSASPFVFLSKQGNNAEYSVRFEPGEKHLLALYLKPSILDMFDLKDDRIPAAINHLLNTPQEGIGYIQLPLSIAILATTKRIINNTYEGNSRIIYTEAKIWELISIIFDESSKIKSLKADNTSEMISESDIELFEHARKILEKSIENTPTISQLSKMVGTNTTKLKQGFKLFFGMTIFECSHQYKMKEALRLLSEEKLSVGIVASSVGYQHQASFAAAFKEYYDILPKEAKKLSGNVHTTFPTRKLFK